MNPTQPEDKELSEILEKYWYIGNGRTKQSNIAEAKQQLIAWRDNQKTFTTYTGETISLCDNCPQFKSNGGWEITQCNDCRKKLEEPSHE